MVRDRYAHEVREVSGLLQQGRNCSRRDHESTRSTAYVNSGYQGPRHCAHATKNTEEYTPLIWTISFWSTPSMSYEVFCPSQKLATFYLVSGINS